MHGTVHLGHLKNNAMYTSFLCIYQMIAMVKQRGFLQARDQILP